MSTYCIQLNVSEIDASNLNIFMGHVDKMDTKLKQSLSMRDVLKISQYLEAVQKNNENDKKCISSSSSESEENEFVSSSSSESEENEFVSSSSSESEENELEMGNINDSNKMEKKDLSMQKLQFNPKMLHQLQTITS
ncbi:PREDICTED: uncharacterized protein LOC108767866 isoform X2 [Trachymyrmex cornetzi]|uniref:uncharacterized protein LOC108767866 isoform X1 n=1 Tax=Trachymyrmex cornetzi TaxID=471704 RepID=UPI00084F13E6|nr:PREDICTED: uncharacterized protein LOC108767866 isoform X1 [Trachymyrmex cornetzi]XP_018373469.1 PREDICTED: uncharacterized protein LOC108767866 isoform X2 [Trachymyrmex cornetzi]